MMVVVSTNEKEKECSIGFARYDVKGGLSVVLISAASLGPMFVKKALYLFAMTSLFVILLLSIRKKEDKTRLSLFLCRIDLIVSQGFFGIMFIFLELRMIVGLL